MKEIDLDLQTAINKKTGIPLYYQIREYIRDKVQNGEWKVGYKLPSETELATRLGVSRTTVRESTNELVLRGMLIRNHGTGTFVARTSFEEDFDMLAFTPTVGGKHRYIGTNIVNPPEQIREILNLELNSKVKETFFLRVLSDGMLAGIERYYLPEEIEIDFSSMDFAGRMKDHLENQANLNITRITTSIKPILITEIDAELLKIEKGLPALEVRRVYYTYKNRPLFVYKNIIRDEACKYLIIL